jgi:aerobic carbon-monoxide dehydrogenase medium subunit
MKAPSFAYVRATTLADIFKLMSEHGPDAKLLAGGQSLLAALAFRLSEPSTLIDVSRVAELKGIEHNGDSIRVGALTTHTELGASSLVRAHVPLIAAAVPHIAHPAIRNRGTIGGSLAFADPAAELPACAVALNANIIAASAAGERSIPAEKFFAGLYETALREGELIRAVEFPVARPDERTAILEIARRSGDYAIAGIVMRASIDGSTVRDPRVVFFGVGDTPVLAQQTMAMLHGQRIDAARVEAGKKAVAADLQPSSDLHGGPEMKRHLAGVLLKRALEKLMSEHGARAA